MSSEVFELDDRCPTCNRPYRPTPPREAVVKAAEAIIAEALAAIQGDDDDGSSGRLVAV